MSRPKKSSAERDLVRERMLAAASDLLESRGPAEVSIRAVTACLGVSAMAFYSYFSSRDELLTALSERQLRTLQESGGQFLDRARSEGASQVLRQVFALFSQSAFQRPRSYLLQWAMPVDEDGGLFFHSQRVQTVLDFLERLVTLGVEQGEFRSTQPQKAALTLFSLFNGPLLLHTSGRLTDSAQLALLLAETERLALLYLTGE
jgi:AcrR family transcriptional regulator